MAIIIGKPNTGSSIPAFNANGFTMDRHRDGYARTNGFSCEEEYSGDPVKLASLRSALSMSGLEYDFTSEGGVGHLVARSNASWLGGESSADASQLQWELEMVDADVPIQEFPAFSSLETSFPGKLATIEAKLSAAKDELQKSGKSAKDSQDVIRAYRELFTLDSDPSLTTAQKAAEVAYWDHIAKGWTSYKIAQTVVRESITLNSVNASGAETIISEMFTGAVAYWSTAGLIASQPKIHTPIKAAVNVISAFINTKNGYGPFWYKHNPRVQTISGGKLTASVEWQMFENYDTYLYTFAS
jgi:hypothetical protein